MKSYYDNLGNYEEPLLSQRTFREFELSSYPCKMRMRFGRKEPGLRVTTFWIIDTVTFTNVERVLHEGRVRYKQTPGFGISRVHELVGMGCLASVFMDEIFILARAVITNFCEETCSFSIYLVDYGFYKTTKLKDLIDVSHISKADPILTLPLSMLRCQLESSSSLKLMDLQRGCEYEFEFLRRKSNGIYLVTADHLRNDDSIISNSSVAKGTGAGTDSATSLPHQVVPEYESIVKMLESKIDLLGSNMVGNAPHGGWLPSSTVYNNPASNLISGMGYNSPPYPFLYWLNNFGYAMPMFMPMVMPMAQPNMTGDASKVVKDDAVNQISEAERSPQSPPNREEEIGVNVDGVYDDSRRRERSGSHGFTRGSGFRGRMRRNVEMDDRRTFHKSQSSDFSRGRRSQDFRRDFGRQRRCSRQDCDKNTFSFGGRENGGDKRSSFGFFSPKNKNSSLINRKRNTAPSFLENASSEWDVPPSAGILDESSSEGRKRSEPVEFF